ncbi:MAG: TonB-dependent receptor domain-containing protein [Acidobacteriota bacterium]
MILLICALPLAAQTGLGVVRGTVVDQSQAVVVDAKVTLTNTNTGVSQTVKTTAAGVFYFASLHPGPYSLTVEMEHFNKWSGTLDLVAGQTAAIDVPLQVGTVANTVEVTGAAPIVETEKGSISDVKDALRIHELPLNGRQITNLFSLTPGVEAGAGGDNSSPRTNGMKVGSTDMVLDGISMVDRFTGGMNRVQPGLDIVQEFRFETAGSDAAFSRPATVSVVSKSGTNQIHGTVFETMRNNYGGLRARQRQDKSATPPKYIRNEYGGTASGPIIKNKAFWLFSYEGMKLRQQNYAETLVPDDAMWGGDFSGMTDTSGQPYTIYDPLTTGADGRRQPFANNIIPSSRLAPVTGTMKSISPEPNVPGAARWTGVNFKTYYPLTQDFNTQTAKYDQVLGDKDNLSVRFTRSDQRNARTGGRYGFPPPGCNNCGGSSLSTFGLYSIVARENHVFRPTLLNEFEVSANRSPNHVGQLSDDTDWATKLGMPNPFGAKGWPTIYTSDWWFLYGGGWDAGNPSDQKMLQYQVSDNMTWIKGKHTMQFGFRGRREFNNVREMQQAQGSHGFYNDWTAQYDPVGQTAEAFTGSGFATLELGLASYLSNQYNRGYFYFRQQELGLYFQDSWKVTPRLTVNYGLRWDNWTPYGEKFDRLVNFDPSALKSTGMEVITPHNTTMESIPGLPPEVLASWAARGTTWKTAEQAGFPGALTPSVYHDFGPRLGVAYQLGNKFVLRASYGMYYWTMPLSQILQSSRVNPPLNLRFQNDISSANGTNYVYSLSVVPAATDYLSGASVTATAAPNGSQQFLPFDIHHWNDDRMQQWNFVIERQLGKNDAFRINYVGTHASNLEQRWAYNDPITLWNYRAATGEIGSTNADDRRLNPNWNFQSVHHDGFANSHSLQAEFEHRTSKGLTFQAFYTWAHAMATTDAGGYSSGNGSANAVGSGYAFLVPQNAQILGNPNLTDSQRLRLGYANSGDVPPQHIRWNGVYELPFGKGKKWGNTASGLVNHLIGGWSIGFIGEWRSGFWTGVNAGNYLFGDPTISKGDRPEVYIFGRPQQLYFRGYFDSSAAVSGDVSQLQQLVPIDRSQRIYRPLGDGFDNKLPQTLADGSVVLTGVNDNLNWNARNFMQGPGAWNSDISLYKTFSITERLRLRFTGDFFNAFNHPNSVNPDTTTGLLNLANQANDPRIIQLSGRIEF